MTQDDPIGFLIEATPEQREAFFAGLDERERQEWSYHWRIFARGPQTAPGGDWRVWMIMAGRGFGKTRAGAEWVRSIAENIPAARIALVAASLPEARSVMVEGESGVLARCAPKQRPRFEPSLRRLTWQNGAQATLYSAGEAEELRGPQHSHARRAGAKGVHRQRKLPADRHRTAVRGRG